MSLSQYEREALREITASKNPTRSLFDRIGALADAPLDFATSKVLDNRLGEGLTHAINSGLQTLNDAAARSVQQKHVLEKYRHQGHASVKTAEDLFALDLSVLDGVTKNLSLQYVVPAFGEGTATGMAGLPGLAADVPLLFIINMRAIADYATHYGFDVSLQAERAFILHVLMYGSTSNDRDRESTLKQLDKITEAVATQATWLEIEKVLSTNIIKKATDVLVKRLTKAKAGQAIPVLGAVVGGGFNAWFTHSTCDAAYQLYRERFLKRRHGAAALR